ncbi:MAG: hypothetical protein EXS58_14585 [Candidatus Latescibacteria bacterium]|nr:hypothetical protein [Candidatus Latescibacterota bacterium]
MLTEDRKRLLDDQGFLLLEGVLSEADADLMRESCLALAAQDLREGCNHTYGRGAQRVWNLVDKGEVFEQAIQHPSVFEAMAYLLGDDFALSSFTANILGPGTPDGGLHIDYPVSNLPSPRPSFPLVANSVWFLDEFTRDNGATSCIPGSHHRLEALPAAGVEYDDEVQVEGPKGSVLILNGAVWHGSSANRTDRNRVGLLGFYCRALLKPQQNHLGIVSQEVVNRATPRLKQLLGYDSQPNNNR